MSYCESSQLNSANNANMLRGLTRADDIENHWGLKKVDQRKTFVESNGWTYGTGYLEQGYQSELWGY